jgi:outer membrane protein TolC
MRNKPIFAAVLCASLCQVAICAEPQIEPQVDPQKMLLNINQVLEMVERNNKDVAAARRSVDVSAQGVKVANAAKLPNIDAALSLNYLGDATIMDRDFTNVMRASVPHFGNSASVTVYQPVYAGGAITAAVDLAKTQQSLSLTELDATRQGVSIQAVGCYLELFKANNLLGVYDENISNTERLLNEMRSRYNEGVVLKNDITRYELRLSTLNYDRLTIANRLAVLNHNLCLMLGLDDGTQVATNIDSELANLPALNSRSSWLDASLTNAPSLKLIDKQRELNSHQRRLIKAERLPHVGLVAGDSFNGPLTFEIPPLNNNYNYWYFGVSVSYNVSSLFKTSKSDVKNALEREQLNARRAAVAESLDRTIDDTYTQFTQAFKMLETEEKNVELATENYRIVENRYNNQLALLTDMLDASTAKLDAEVRLVNARVNIIYYYYQLKYNSGTL